MAKAQAELDNVVGRFQRVEDADIPNLEYLQVVIKKALQLHPATPSLIPHMNKKSMQCVQVCLTCGDHGFGECWWPSLRPKIVGGSIGIKT